MSKAAQNFGMPMLQALGLDAKRVTGFTISCEVGSFPTIAVTSVLPMAVGEAASVVLRRYRLEPIEEVSLPAVDESASLESLTRTTHRLVDSPESDRT